MQAFSNIGTIVTLSDKPSSSSDSPYMYLIIGEVIFTVDFQYTYATTTKNGGSKDALGLGTVERKICAFRIISNNSNIPLVTKHYTSKGVKNETAINEAYNILSNLYRNIKSTLDSESFKYEVKRHICDNS